MPGSVPAELYDKLPRHNFIDGHVWAKLRQLGVTPSDSAGDATFHRRAFLDIIGRLPTPDETRGYLAAAAPEKGEQLLARWLARPECAGCWAGKRAALWRPSPFHCAMKA